MTKVLWKFGQNPLRNVEVAQWKKLFMPTTDTPHFNNQIFPSENLVNYLTLKLTASFESMSVSVWLKK